MKIVAIVQARMGSTRLPGKVMKLISGKPMIELLLKRLSKAKKVDQIIVATSNEKNNKLLKQHLKTQNFDFIEGSENDVLDRFLLAAKHTNADIIVRITADCPLVDASLIDKSIIKFKKLKLDYYSNVLPATYPDGLDIEIFTHEALKKSSKMTTSLFDREHVTAFLRESKNFKTGNFQNKKNLSSLRWTVDEAEDLQVISSVFQNFMPNIFFDWKEVLELQINKPHLFSANKNIERNIGDKMSKGQKLWNRAKKIIPGGNMLLSKRPEMFLPDQWPSYFSKAQGCTIWDLDGLEYTDMSYMGVGTNILGYGHPEVDKAVQDTIKSGNMSTLNAPEEVYLAEKLIELHPWSGMARFARTGGEANAIAVRIGRAASGKDKIAVCGYHGWHDWYLSANLGSKENLEGHLLPGLEPNGVPKNLRETIYPFKYNNYEEIEKLVNEHDIGVIKMEVERSQQPTNDFLQKVRKLANKNGIVLIFDECTSGFRECFGGLHKKYKVNPDLAVFGKALGNGYAITSIIGRREVMEAAQSSFISSTFWTERIGSSAALKTLEIMERERSWEQITASGFKIRQKWDKLASNHSLNIQLSGIPALSSFSFNSKNSLKYKTLITQEMLKKGFLAGNAIYTCIEHQDKIIDDYCEKLDPIFKLIKECEDGRSIDELISGPVCHDGFKRLN